MSDRWSVDRVMAAAPDSSSQVAGRKLATPGPWSQTGASGAMVWGECRGSSKTPYRVSVDTEAPAYRCSCPSRKFPCKHCLGLLFLWAQGQLNEDGSVGAAPQWAAPPAKKAETAADEDAEDSPEKAEQRRAAAEQRVRQREDRVTAGMTELMTWLDDQVTRGLVRSRTDRRATDEVAARMVDAQAPGVARRLQAVAGPWSGGDWVGTALDQLGLLRLLAQAWLDRDHLDPDLVATVRGHLGFTVPSAEVLQLPPVRDHWLVAGLHDVDDERVATRRVWLQGATTRRWALVLLFSVNGAAFDSTLAPGTVIDADLHVHPGTLGLRATIGEKHADVPGPVRWDAGAGTVAELQEAYAATLARDPWVDLMPIGVRGRLGRIGDAWALTDDEGRSVRLTGAEEALWKALALAASAPVSALGEWSPAGLNPLCVIDPEVTGGEVVVL
ncbi:SWIM zinc finger family protein [Mariniluteicoccus flavus]